VSPGHYWRLPSCLNHHGGPLDRLAGSPRWETVGQTGSRVSSALLRVQRIQWSVSRVPISHPGRRRSASGNGSHKSGEGGPAGRGESDSRLSLSNPLKSVLHKTINSSEVRWSLEEGARSTGGVEGIVRGETVWRGSALTGWLFQHCHLASWIRQSLRIAATLDRGSWTYWAEPGSGQSDRSCIAVKERRIEGPIALY
jgi:hypothetical protein